MIRHFARSTQFRSCFIVIDDLERYEGSLYWFTTIKCDENYRLYIPVYIYTHT